MTETEFNEAIERVLESSLEFKVGRMNRLQAYADSASLCLEVLHNSENMEEAKGKIIRFIDCARERRFHEFMETTRRELGMWKIP